MTRMALAAAMLLAGAARGEEAVWRVETAKGWFDDALALDDAGGRLALVVNDGEGGLDLEVRDVEHQGAVVARAALGDVVPAGLVFTRVGPMVLVRRDDTALAVLYDAAGRRVRTYGPANEIAHAVRGGRELVAVVTRRGATHEVVLHDVARGKVLVKRVVGDADFTPRTWRNGWTAVGGRRAGRYDPKLDRRTNDTEAVWDVVEGRFVSEGATDLVTQARVLRERERRPGAGAFVFVDGGRLWAVTEDDRLAPVELPLSTYEVESLRQQARGDEITFSLRVDPLNPEAIARQKRDPEAFEVFRWSGGTVTRVLRLVGDGREVVWHAAGGRIAVLRKHRAFGRGGPEVAVYPLR